MSGTSLDGLDVVCAHMDFTEPLRVIHEIIKAKTYPYPEELRSRLAQAMRLDGLSLMELDAELGTWMGEKVQEFRGDLQASPQFISTHGHTVFHQPDQGFTTQIGSAMALHAVTGLPTIYDFRSLDVALGGQGAPLVPIGDKLLFHEYQACLNIGGFANVTVHTPDSSVLAFDICPANTVLNALARDVGHTMDQDGILARSGEILPALLSALNELAYFTESPPKTLGQEWVEANIDPVLERFANHETRDILFTFCEHVALQIGTQLTEHLGTNNAPNMLVTGGGAFNTFLMERISNHVPPNLKMEVPNEELVQFKEALVFALLGALRLRGEVNCLSTVTGAARDSCGGSIIGINA